MPKSIGEALMKGVPVVFTVKGRAPEIVCEPGKEKEALELLDKMGIVKMMRPGDGRRPEGTMKPYVEVVQ